MIAPSQRAEEVLEHEPETVLRLRSRQRRGRRLVTEDEFDLGNDLGENRAIGPERSRQAEAPRRLAVLALRQQLLHQSPERLDQRAERVVARDLVELSRDEVAA